MLSFKLRQLLFAAAKVVPQEVRSEYLRANKGSDKDFDKEREGFAANLAQTRALDLVNFYLRQLQTQVEITSLLQAREQGQ
jgi:hypothetical protein